MLPTEGPALDERIFLILSFGVGALLVVAVMFAVLTLLLRARNNLVARRWTALEAKWEPVLLEVLSGDEEPRSLLRLVESGEELRFLSYLLRYTRRLTGSEVDLLRELARPHLPRLTRELEKASAERRARAVQTIGVLGLPEARDLVRRSLDDESPLVSIIAAQALAEPGHPAHVQLILDRLERYSDWHPAFLAGMLAAAGEGAAPFLREALADTERTAPSRSVIAQALRELRDPRAADVAATVLPGTDDPDLVVACLRLLVEVGDGRHREVVLPLLASPHFQVRSHALKALGTIGDETDVPAFRDAIDDPSPWVALEAARGLRDLGHVETLEEMAVGEGPRASLARQVITE